MISCFDKMCDYPSTIAEDELKKLNVVYLTCSSFSGSTLLTLLLNDHPNITSVGHTSGWRYNEGDRFLCSCALPLERCPFWGYVAAEFRKRSLPFQFNNFGTHYEFFANERLTRYLLYQLPFIQSTRVDTVRDSLVRYVPGLRKTLARKGKANVALIQAALGYNAASVYVDNSHSPYRLRLLSSVSELDLSVIYLIRDIHGVVYSQMKNRGRSAEIAARAWLQDQMSIIRIIRQFDYKTRVSYEALCDSTQATLAQIQKFLHVAPRSAEGTSEDREHHILGNDMRLKSRPIAKDTRWKSELSSRELSIIRTTALKFVSRSPSHPLSPIILGYLESE